MRFAQLVIGPAGSGKSTYCAAVANHGVDSNRIIDVVNLDPAAEYFAYQPLADIRDLIQVQDTMEDPDLHFGPNGGLVFCMEYLVENADWLRDKLEGGGSSTAPDDDYILFDCPGQIELYTHLSAMRKLVTQLQRWDFNVCCVFLLDVRFVTDGAQFLGATMASLSAMVNLELPHINLLTKMDLLGKKARRKLLQYLDPDMHSILGDIEATSPSSFSGKYRRLTEAISDVIANYSLVRFLPFNLKSVESISDILLTIDNAIQYGEDLDVKTRDFDEGDQEDDVGP